MELVLESTFVHNAWHCLTEHTHYQCSFLLYFSLSCGRKPTTKRYLCMKILPNILSMHPLIPRYLTPGTHLLLKLHVNRSVPHEQEDTFTLRVPTHKY